MHCYLPQSNVGRKKSSRFRHELIVASLPDQRKALLPNTIMSLAAIMLLMILPTLSLTAADELHIAGALQISFP